MKVRGNMLDTTPITTEIARRISTRTTEQALLAAVARAFPELSPAELSQALQVAQAAAERQAAAAARRH
jgi:nucleoid-associated protein YgaU